MFAQSPPELTDPLPKGTKYSAEVGAVDAVDKVDAVDNRAEIVAMVIKPTQLAGQLESFTKVGVVDTVEPVDEGRVNSLPPKS